MNKIQTPDAKPAQSINWGPLILGVVVLLVMIGLFRDGLSYMVGKWEREEYSHGYLIPPVALYLLWLRAERFGQATLSGSWFGPLLVVFSLAAFVLGELSSVYQIIEYGFLLGLFGLIIATVGWSGFKIVWVPFVYLLFMIPLPQFLYAGLSAELQLISSELGVAVIRFFAISVYLEGNVIDLGVYQLQVAEACSGLRYLFPLLSFGFLCAAIYIGPWWHRTIIFLSAIPLTIFMNSFRIGVIGVLVSIAGIEQAEGFLHDFEGWVVFMTCVGILFLEMWVLARLGGHKLMDVFALDIPPLESARHLLPKKIPPQMIASVLVLGVGVVIATMLTERENLTPERQSFSTFPLIIDEWRGQDQVIEDVTLLASLSADDYFLAEYRDGDEGHVGFWVAYYAEQRKGSSVHSPKACLPGGGWEIESFDQHELREIGPAGENYIVNRAVIAKGDARQLVYYWFVERGRIQTNEYLVKWSIFWDALTINRTEGALVRATIFVDDASRLAEADEMLEGFVRSIDPKLSYFLPPPNAVMQQAEAGGTGSANF